MLPFCDVARRQRSARARSSTRSAAAARGGAPARPISHQEGTQPPIKASCPGTNDGRRVFGESRTYSRLLLPQARCVSRRSGRPETHLLRAGIRPGGTILRGLVMRRRDVERCSHAPRCGPLTMSGYPGRSCRFEKSQRRQLTRNESRAPWKAPEWVTVHQRRPSQACCVAR